MNLDTIIDELNNIVRDRRCRGLEVATEKAPRLLEQPRYEQADNRSAALAGDIRAAVARLPPTIRKQARGLLPIAKPNELLAGRQRYLGISGYSAPARRWHRTAILTRLAVELVDLYGEARPSLRILATRIDIDHGSYTDIPRNAYYRVITFTWEVESTVSDCRRFFFMWPTEKPLKFSRFEVHPTEIECDAVERLKVAGSSTDHWHILFFKDNLPIGRPVTISAFVEHRNVNKAPAIVDFTPLTPTERLIFFVRTFQDTTRHRCVAWDDAKSKVAKEYKAKIIRKSSGLADVPEHTFDTSRFNIPTPRVGQRYRIMWPPDSRF